MKRFFQFFKCLFGFHDESRYGVYNPVARQAEMPRVDFHLCPSCCRIYKKKV